MEDTKIIVQVACCVVSPDTTLEEDDDAGRARVRIVMGNEERKIFVIAEISDNSCCVDDVPSVER
jgi:hypothetical protein